MEPKIPLSLRVHPELKAAIENEALESGWTISKYLEIILKNRKHDTQSVIEPEEDWKLQYQELLSKNVLLEDANVELETTVNELLVINENLKSECEKHSQEIESFRQKVSQAEGRTEIEPANSISFTLEEKTIFFNLLGKLQKAYPELSSPQLLLACLRTTLKNERSYFFIHQIGANVK